MLTSAGIKLKIVVNVKMLGSPILRVKPVILVIENSLKCHCTFFYVQTFRAKPIVTSWHTPYEKTNDESALACNARARAMKAFFQARGYPEALLNGDLCKISTVSRNEALRPPVERDATESRVPLVLTHNQFTTGTKRILLDNFEMLLSDPATRTIYPELPLVSYRRDRNLRDYLVHSAERTD